MHEKHQNIPLMPVDSEDLHFLEKVFGLSHGALRLEKTPSRLLLDGLPLAHEIHYVLTLRWWGWRLTVYQLETFGVGRVNGQLRTWEVPDSPTVAIVEPGRTSVLGRFRLDKTVRRTNPGSKTEVYAQYKLSRRWWG